MLALLSSCIQLLVFSFLVFTCNTCNRTFDLYKRASCITLFCDCFEIPGSPSVESASVSLIVLFGPFLHTPTCIHYAKWFK